MSIPLKIFQTWHSKELLPSVKESIETVQLLNPEFQYFLFDQDECRQFIHDNYPQDVLDAYDMLLPEAYKADLWRYCVLYKLGGIYLDSKLIPVNNFKFIYMIDKEHFCKDLPNPAYKQGIYNAFIICKPGNKIIEQCIQKCVENCKHKFYGDTCLEVTGPTMMIQFFNQHDMEECEELHHTYYNGAFFIAHKDIPILMIHPNYRREYQEVKDKHTLHYYPTCWENKTVFGESLHNMDDVANIASSIESEQH